jgi:hypothetical protein
MVTHPYHQAIIKTDSGDKQRVPLNVTADELFKHAIPSEIKDAFMIQTLNKPKITPHEIEIFIKSHSNTLCLSP